MTAPRPDLIAEARRVYLRECGCRQYLNGREFVCAPHQSIACALQARVKRAARVAYREVLALGDTCRAANIVKIAILAEDP